MLKEILYTGLDPHFYKGQGKVTHLPLIRIVPRPLNDPAVQRALALFSDYTHVLFTSKSTVHLLWSYLLELGFSLNTWTNKITLAVGKVTAAHLKNYGIQASRVAKEETAEGLLHELQEMRLDDAFIFWPHSAQSRPILTNYFHQHHLSFQECFLYETLPFYPAIRPSLDQFDEIIFTSPSTVQAFLQIFGSLPSHKTLTPIGPVTKAYLTHLTQKEQNEEARDFEKSINSKSAAIFY